MEVSRTDIKALLRQFGHTSFRPGQERVIRALLDGRDVLALLPTGAGKSLVYQLTAQLLPGATVVVSPLIALMQDQVESITERGFDVSVIDSTRSGRAAEDALQRLGSTESKLLYVTPERFDDESFMAHMRRISVSLFVVDEAHCISEWGHSFRPSYLTLPDAIKKLGRPVVLALTATATPWIRREIVERLGMRDPHVVVRGIDRPNLFFEVRRVESEDEDRRVLQRLLLDEGAEYPPGLADELAQSMRGSGIIYTATTAAARKTAEWLRGWGIAADYYHGRRRKADRTRVQDAFMSGELRVIAATNAFGLGVDKPDVRFVIHRDVPGSIEAYYQEAGRAGRDGAFARCTLIYRPGDIGRAAFLSSGGYLTRDEVRRAWPGLLAHPNGTRRDLEAATGLSKADLTRLLAVLARENITAERRGRIRLLEPDFDPDMVSLEDEDRRRTYERSRVDMMRAYAEMTGCRRRYILNYFAEEYEKELCDFCDNCEAGIAVQRDARDEPFAVNSRVAHPEWGAGQVMRYEGDTILVLFDDVGYKNLALDIVRERGLLEPAGDEG